MGSGAELALQLGRGAMKHPSEEGRLKPCPRCQTPLVCDDGVVPRHGKRVGEGMRPCESPNAIGFTRDWAKEKKKEGRRV
jgi:hypothetical protein